MAATIGNHFWELRSSHGIEKIFADPDILWQAACEYFQWCVDNPLMSVEQARAGKGKVETETELTEDGVKQAENDTGLIELPKMRAFTMQGLAGHFGCNVKTLWDYEHEKSHKDFHPIMARVRDVLYRQKFEGAAAGLLNANLIARELGLSDKKEITAFREQPMFPDLIDQTPFTTDSKEDVPEDNGSK